MNEIDTTQSAAAHAAYLAQTRQLVDTRTDALFDMLLATVSQAQRYEPAAREAGVERHDRTLSVDVDPCSAEFAVEAISDLPDGVSRALLFPAGQARCHVRLTDGTAAVWQLKRDRESNQASLYAWMPAGTETHVGEPELNRVLRPLLECRSLQHDQNLVPAATAEPLQ